MHYLELCHGLVALKIKNIWDYFQERTRNACNINFWWLGNLRLPCKRRIDFKIQFLHPIFIWNESSWNKSIKNVKNFSICEGSISNSLKNHNSFGCIAIRCMYNSTYTPQLHAPLIGHIHFYRNHDVKIHLLMFENAQLTFTCSQSTIETLEKGVKYVQC